MNTMLTSAIAAMSLWIIPLVIGRVATAGMAKRMHLTAPIAAATAFAAGSIIVYLASFTMTIAVALGVTISTESVRLGLFALLGLAGAGAVLSLQKPSKRQLITGSLLVAIAAGAYAIWRRTSPYAMPLNWDIWEHQTLVDGILAGKLQFVASKMSDTFRFDGYPTFFHALVAAPQYLFSPDVLGFWWFAEFFHLLTATVAGFVLTMALTRNRLTGLIAAFVTAFTFESSVVYGSFFLMPQTIAAVLWTISLAGLVHAGHDHERPAFLAYGIIAIALILTHYIVGSAGVAMLAAYLILSKTNILRHDDVFHVVSLALPVAVAVGLSAFSAMFGGTSLNNNEAVAFTADAWTTLRTILSWYGGLPIVLLPVGVFALAKHTGHTANRPLLAVASIALGVILARAPYVLKFYVLERYIDHAIMAAGVFQIVGLARSAMTKTIVVAALAVAVITAFTTTTVAWQAPVTVGGVASQVSTDEIDAALYLRTAYAGRRALLVSDPATQYILETLSGVDSQGGAYMDITTRTALAKADANTLVSRVAGVRDLVSKQTPERIVFVVGGRFTAWYSETEEKKTSIPFNIWTPKAMSLEDQLLARDIAGVDGVREVYRNGSVVIYDIPVREGGV